jgi:hypothetical protein
VGPEHEVYLKELARRSNDSQIEKQTECNLFGSDRDDTSHGKDVEKDGSEDTHLTNRVFYLSFLFSYDVTGNMNLTTITGAEVLKMIANMGTSFKPSPFNLGFHFICIAWLTIFELNTHIAHYGYKDPPQQVLAIYDRKDLEAVNAGKRAAKRTSKLKVVHTFCVQRCPSHANNRGHVVCSNNRYTH